ncbi:MAG: site-specific DNA-methyltransferase, partial [Bacteroidales bacterium]|nr:site-specific DNA-methyltransferase [Bacteroidales bacterium]
MKLYETLEEQLKQEPNFVTDEGELKKWVVINKARNFDAELIGLLLDNEDLKEKFFVEVKGTMVFNQNLFIQFLEQKNYLNDSYTQFKNKIGLTIDGKYLKQRNEVSLVWPFKDCILEGGQSKEEQKREEIFFNETLAQDEITQLLEPKVLTNVITYDKEGEHSFKEFKRDAELNKKRGLPEDTITDNLIIKGNNLLALHTLKKEFSGKVDLICIDPPYNRGDDDFNYNDTFNHSAWLTFMHNRLEVAKTLLTDKGTIFVFCDDNEHAYLKILLDEVFDRKHFVSTIIWRNSDNSNNDAKQFSKDHNYILVYSKNPNWRSINLPRNEEQSRHYKNPDNDPRGPWFDGNPVNSPNPRKNLMYDLKTPSGKIIQPPINGWRWDKEIMQQKIKSGEIRFNDDETGIKRRTYLKEQKGLPPSTLWKIKENSFWDDLKVTGHTRQAKYEQKKLFTNLPTSKLFKTPKPEKVIQQIIHISTIEGDLVMDFFGGSGTFGAVAHKMGRQYFLCEQMDYIETFTIERLKKVVHGDNVGISKELNWQGGGSFKYLELKKYNQTFIEQIEEAKDSEALLNIWEQMKEKSFLNYNVDIKKQEDHI